MNGSTDRYTVRSSWPDKSWIVPLVRCADANGDIPQDGQYVPQSVIDKLAAYEDTGLTPQDIQEAVDLFQGTNYDVPKEIKSWVERATWHCRKCAELGKQVNELNDKLRQYEQCARYVEWEHLGGDEWCCPKCGHVIFTEGSWEHPLERGCFFCEHCGADLRGDQVSDKNGDIL